MLRLAFLPLGALLLVWPTLSYPAPLADGLVTNCEGAPLIWNCDALARSMHEDVFVVPLLIDLGVILTVAAALTLPLERMLHGSARRAYAVVAGAIWIAGGVAAVGLAIILINDASFHAWPPDRLDGPYGPPRIDSAG